MIWCARERSAISSTLEFLRLASAYISQLSRKSPGLARYVAHQVYYSLIGRDYEWDLMPQAIDQKIGAVVWSPLGWARLTGKVAQQPATPECQ